MTRPGRQTALLLALLAALAAACLWSWGALGESRRAARGAGEELTVSQRHAQQIIAARRGPNIAASAQPQLELTGHVERAAREAGVPPDRIERIGPEQQRRLGANRTERSRQLFVRDVTLTQLAEFLGKLSEQGGVTVGHIRLSTPREAATPADGETTESWNGEAVVSYTVFEPAVRDPAAAR